MALVESNRRSDPTHVVRTRSLPGVKDWDAEGGLSVENRVLDVAMEYGSAVHLCLDRALLTDTAPDRLSIARERFERLDDPRRRLRNEYPEYRVRIPADAERVRSCLALEAGDTDGWLARLHGIAEIAVVTPDSWLYRSVPHHAHIRELNADPVDGFLEDVAVELESTRWSAVVPIDALVSWFGDEYRYELRWNALRRQPRSCDGDSWTVFDLERLRTVSLTPSGMGLRFRWQPRRNAAGGVRRVLAAAVDQLSAEPPTRVAAPDGEAVDDIASTLRELRAQFEYDYAFEGNERVPKG